MKNSVVLILLLVVFATYFRATTCKKALKENAKIDNKIVGGNTISIKKVPYQVYLSIKLGDEYGTCGGSIISKNYVLTSGYCLYMAQVIYVLIATTDITNGGLIYNATSWTIHPDFSLANGYYDVGVVYISEGIALDGIDSKIVELAPEGMSLETGSNVLVTGWGHTSENANYQSRTLMGVELPIVDHDECKNVHSDLTDYMFCAGVEEGGKDACTGDSGSPAVLTETGIQVGITSFNDGCARENSPRVFVNIGDPSIREFIKNNTDVQ